MSQVRGILNIAGDAVLFWCPACDMAHAVNSSWSFNGDYEKPTFQPSVLAEGSAWENVRCHSFVRDGRMEYLTDCTHEFAGGTLKIPAWPWPIP